MIKEMYRANPRDYDDYSRSESREREKRDSINNRQPSKNAIYKGFKLHIANLPLGVSEEFVKLQFERFGKVEDVRIMRKDSNGQPLKGSLYGFVTMFTKEDAAYALDEINKEKMLAWNVSYSKEGKKNHNDASRSPQRMGRAKARQNRELNEEKTNAKLHENPVTIQAPKRKESTDIFFARSYTGVTEETCSNPDDYISYGAGHGADEALLLTFLAENSKESHQSAHETDLAKTAAETPSEKLSSTTSSSEKTMLKGNPIRVRELWFGNLSQNLDEHELKYHVEMFGEIENIEYYTKPNTSFAFVKFKEITQASRASESTQNLKNILNSPNLKIAFSDHQRRKNVVGDSLDYERDEDLTSIVYIGFPSGSTVANENIIREVFSFCGEAVDICINQTPKQNSAKSYALVEMATLEQAKIARQKLFFDDNTREHRIKLGDRNCEIAILPRPKNKDHFNNSHMNFRPNQMQQRQNRYNNFNPHPDFQPHFQQGPMNPHQRMNHGPMFPNNHFNGPRDFNGHPMRNPFPGGPNHPNFHMGGPGFGMHGGMNRFPMDHPHYFQNPSQNPNFANHGYGMNFGHNMHGGYHPNHHMNPNFGPGYNHMEGDRKMHDENLGYGNSTQSSTTASANAKSPKERLMYDNHEIIWSGYITKNKQGRVGVDAIVNKGDDSVFQGDFNLNISHRAPFDEVLKRPHKAIVTFVASNETQNGQFQEYIKYFLERNRAGVATLHDSVLYLLPPCEITNGIQKITDNEILGIFVSTEEPAPEVSQLEITKQKSKESIPQTDDIDTELDANFDVNEVMSILNNTDIEKLLESV